VRQYRIKVALFYQWIAANRRIDQDALVAFGNKLRALST
jgi:hypothetical protein